MVQARLVTRPKRAPSAAGRRRHSPGATAPQPQPQHQHQHQPQPHQHQHQPPHLPPPRPPPQPSAQPPQPPPQPPPQEQPLPPQPPQPQPQPQQPSEAAAATLKGPVCDDGASIGPPAPYLADDLALQWTESMEEAVRAAEAGDTAAAAPPASPALSHASDQTIVGRSGHLAPRTRRRARMVSPWRPRRQRPPVAAVPPVDLPIKLESRAGSRASDGGGRRAASGLPGGGGGCEGAQEGKEAPSSALVEAEPLVLGGALLQKTDGDGDGGGGGSGEAGGGGTSGVDGMQLAGDTSLAAMALAIGEGAAIPSDGQIAALAPDADAGPRTSSSGGWRSGDVGGADGAGSSTSVDVLGDGGAVAGAGAVVVAVDEEVKKKTKKAASAAGGECAGGDGGGVGDGRREGSQVFAEARQAGACRRRHRGGSVGRTRRRHHRGRPNKEGREGGEGGGEGGGGDEGGGEGGEEGGEAGGEGGGEGGRKPQPTRCRTRTSPRSRRRRRQRRRAR